jgi:hypothetical protein
MMNLRDGATCQQTNVSLATKDIWRCTDASWNASSSEIMDERSY